LIEGTFIFLVEVRENGLDKKRGHFAKAAILKTSMLQIEKIGGHSPSF